MSDQENIKTKFLSVRDFPEVLHTRLKLAAVKRNKTMADLLADIVKQWLDANEPEH